MADSSARASSRFERHPRLTLLVLALVAVVLADFGFTFVLARFRPDFYRERSAFRVRSAIYHHGFQPGVSVDDERWGPLVASYRIDSLGFRDAGLAHVKIDLIASDAPRVNSGRGGALRRPRPTNCAGTAPTA